MNRLTARYYAVMKYLGTLSPKLNVYVKFLTSELRKCQERGGRKNSRKRGNGGHQKYKVLSINIIKAYKDWQRLDSMYMTSQVGTSWGL